MILRSPPCRCRRRRSVIATTASRFSSRAITLIEMLVVIGIMSALIAILLPALSASRERGRVAVCIANLKEIGTAFTAYQSDAQPYRLPWYVRWSEAGKVRFSSGSGYGGVRSATSRKRMAPPAAARPLIRYLGVQDDAEGGARVFRCPSDGPSYTWRPRFGRPSGSTTPVYPSQWEQWGNCYPFNLHWLERRLRRRESMYAAIDRLGPNVLRHKTGGEAAKFVLAYEDPADASFWQSRLDHASSRAISVLGWHGQFGEHTLLFYDGHVTHQPVDTRLSVGPTWSVW